MIGDPLIIQPTTRPRLHLGLPAACALLAAATLAAAVIACWYAQARPTPGMEKAGIAAPVVAAVTCWLSATSALTITGLLAGMPNAVSGILGGTLVRLAGPLMVTAANGAAGTPVFQAGLFGYMVVFFVYTLIVETLLLVAVIGGRQGRGRTVADQGCGRGILTDG